MSRQVRSNDIELNFDGLTDSVTNLVGSLILLVVLVVGLTSEVRPKELPKAASEEVKAERSIASLIEQVEILSQQIRSVDQEVRTIEGRMPDHQQRIQTLLGKVGQGSSAAADHSWIRLVLVALNAPLPARGPQPATSQPGSPDTQAAARTQMIELRVQQGMQELNTLAQRVPPLQGDLRKMIEQVEVIQPPKKKEEPPPAPKPPRRVNFRPPLEKISEKSDIIFVCEEGGISYVDLEAINAAAKGKQAADIQFDIANSDFRAQGAYEDGRSILKLIRKPGMRGETWEQAQKANSKFQKLLRSHPAEKYNINFSVYPDSQDVFRQARSLVWEKSYEVGWDPEEPGKPIRLGSGPGLSATQ